MELPAPRPHSQFGIASFVLGMAAIVLVVISLIATRVQAHAPSTEGISWLSILPVGLPLVLALYLLPVSTGFGIAALFQRGSRLVYAGWGLACVVGAPLLLVGGLMLMGG